jgi:hypothetical protein
MWTMSKDNTVLRTIYQINNLIRITSNCSFTFSEYIGCFNWSYWPYKRINQQNSYFENAARMPEGINNVSSTHFLISTYFIILFFLLELKGIRDDISNHVRLTNNCEFWFHIQEIDYVSFFKLHKHRLWWTNVVVNTDTSSVLSIQFFCLFSWLHNCSLFLLLCSISAYTA